MKNLESNKRILLRWDKDFDLIENKRQRVEVQLHSFLTSAPDGTNV
jgi:hypothetical protein